MFSSTPLVSPLPLPLVYRNGREKEKKKKQTTRTIQDLFIERSYILTRFHVFFFGFLEDWWSLRGWEMLVLFFINESSFPFAKKREDLIGKIIKFRNFNVDTLKVLKFWKGSRYLKLIFKWNFEILEIFTWYSRSLCYNIMQNDVKIKCNII